MKVIEMTGRTVEDAVESALKELNLTRDKVDIDVIEEGSRGLFNLIGVKPARVKVTVKKDFVLEAKFFLRNILDAMKIKAEIKINEKGDTLYINVVSPNMALLIGHHGDTLDSMQYLVSLVINKDNTEEFKRVILDIENYRMKREETLKRLAIKFADNAKKYKKPQRFEPMNPYERRIIHSSLQELPNIITYSEGEEPNRRVIVEYKKA
ncbi:MAG: protein jag [Oscillospiraceae bacterium]|nr:protein jag [Oscillospiraceae bacterium]